MHTPNSTNLSVNKQENKFGMKYKLLKAEVYKLQDGSPGNDEEAILKKLLTLEVADVKSLSKMPDFKSLCKS
ncbi:hypothetical protein FVER53590_25522 [Fusarium verticillioides]|nr:hypothetical protein FVER53590_25522 [Fusarium verticillioides]